MKLIYPPRWSLGRCNRGQWHRSAYSPFRRPLATLLPFLDAATKSRCACSQFCSSTRPSRYRAASLISALVLPSWARFHNSAGSTVGFCTCSGCVFAGASLTTSVSGILTILGGATFSELGRGQLFAILTTGAASLISALVLPSWTRFHNSAGSTAGFFTCSGCVFAGASLTASV